MKIISTVAGWIANAWKWSINWLEKGNLVPFLVIASAWHYTKVLAQHDPQGVAIAIGVLVDLGAYRAVMIAVRYVGVARSPRKRAASAGQGAKRPRRRRSSALKERTWRYAIAFGMTGISLYYHLSYYMRAQLPWWLLNWPLALPLPVLIFALAYFDRKDRRAQAPTDTPTTETSAHPANTSAQNTVKRNGRKTQADFERAVSAGDLNINLLTGEELAEWAHVSASTGRRWLVDARKQEDA